MFLPFEVDYEPPRRGDLRAAARSRWVWAVVGLAVAVGVVLVVLHLRARAAAEMGAATLLLTSAPIGAAIEVDGRAAGRTPTRLALAPGEHQLRLRRDGYADAAQTVTLTEGETLALAPQLWLSVASATRLRPTFPGATVANAGFLADGRVVLTVTVPPGTERQVWVLDDAGGTERLGPPEAPRGLAVTSDGGRFAYLANGQGAVGAGSLDDRPTAVLTGARGEQGRRVFALQTGAADERLVDLTWAPDGRHLLAASHLTPAGGGERTRLLWIDPAGAPARELVTLPSEIVPGSYAWSPDGGQVALLTRAGSLSSLCLLAVPSGEFRYLADLGRDDTAPLPIAPVAWSPDGQRIAYAAPTDDKPGLAGLLFGASAPIGLFTAGVERLVGQRLGSVAGQSPAWRADGSIIALARPRPDRPLVVAAVGPDGTTNEVAQLPFGSASVYAARWDLARRQAIVAVRGSAGFGATRPDFWLVRFSGEAER